MALASKQVNSVLSVNSNGQLKLLYFTWKKKKKILNLFPFHQAFCCSYIIWLPKKEEMVAPNSFAKTFVTSLPCTLVCPGFYHLVYINPAPLYSCVQVCCAPGKELACCTARLDCQVATGQIKWTRGSFQLLWVAKLPCSRHFSFQCWKAFRFIIKWIFKK